MENLELIARLATAVAAGAAIGLDRDLHGRPSGVRLHGLVARGAAIFTLVGLELDPAGATRVIQGIVGGIGFLGAGVIMHGAAGGSVRALQTRTGADGTISPQPGEIDPNASPAARLEQRFGIHHLTTAASIWLTAALGVAAAAGLWRLVLYAAVAALVLLVIGIRIDRALFARLGREEERGEPIG